MARIAVAASLALVLVMLVLAAAAAAADASSLSRALRFGSRSLARGVPKYKASVHDDKITECAKTSGTTAAMAYYVWASPCLGAANVYKIGHKQGAADKAIQRYSVPERGFMNAFYSFDCDVNSAPANENANTCMDICFSKVVAKEGLNNVASGADYTDYFKSGFDELYDNCGASPQDCRDKVEGWFSKHCKYTCANTANLTSQTGRSLVDGDCPAAQQQQSGGGGGGPIKTKKKKKRSAPY